MRLCALLEENKDVQNGCDCPFGSAVGISEKTLSAPLFCFVHHKSKSRILSQLVEEIRREDFRYVVPDFRLNKAYDRWKTLSWPEKEQGGVFVAMNAAGLGCKDRKACYEAVSRKNLGENREHHCTAPESEQGYCFSKAMQNPGFIGIEAIQNVYFPMGFSNFKIEGRGLGSALILEFLLYYMTKPQYQLHVREEIYLDNMLDLF